MKETWKSANERMACLTCGESGAHPYTASLAGNPGKPVRVCVRCLHSWEHMKLTPRAPMYEEPGAESVRA